MLGITDIGHRKRKVAYLFSCGEVAHVVMPTDCDNPSPLRLFLMNYLGIFGLYVTIYLSSW